MTSVDGQNANLVGRTLGAYRLDGLLGAGGMAEVYRALDTKLQRAVAVKVLPASLALDPGYVERFRSEGRQVAALDHPHIVPVYQYGEDDGLLFLVMPVLKESLRDRLDREGRLSPSEATRLAVQIASALDAAHARGLVHRDVKPENILLNDEGRALLTDFGIAREVAFLRETGVARTLAASGLPVGTPEYMAPEQLRGLPVDQRADVYALGAVLYELLTGVVPHDAATPYEVAALVLTAPTAAPSTHNPQIWPELDAVVLRALAKTPELRFADARSFALALRQVVVERGRPTAGVIPSVRWTQYAPPLGSANALATPASLGNLNGVSAGVMAPAPLGSPTIDAEATHPSLRDRSAPDLASPAATATMRGLTDVTLADGAMGAGGFGGFGAGGFGGGGFGGGRFGGGAGRARTAQAQPRRRNIMLLLSAGLLLAIVLGVLGVATLNGFNPFASGPSPSGPGATGSHHQATATTAPTVTPHPTATATTAPTATPVPQPPLALNPSTVSTFSFGRDCGGTVAIKNTGAQTVGWSWQDATPGIHSLQYQINGGAMHNGNPSDSSLESGASDSVRFFFRCDSGQQYTIPITDSLQNTYTLTVDTSQSSGN